MFPALAGQTVFFDNAGGSQLPRCVIDAMRRYMEETFVQLHADYALSARASLVIPRAREAVKVFLNGHGGNPAHSAVGAGIGDVIFGASTTALCYELAGAYADARDALLRPGAAPRGMRAPPSRLLERDQIVVSTAGHEANVGPWVRLALRGYTVIPWQAEPQRDPLTGRLAWRPSLDTLRGLVNRRTLLVLAPQVSNILGEVWDVRAVAEVAHAVGARVVIDGVAFAPHRAPDMADLACDWYVYSTYKVFGPHMAAMFGTREALAELTGPNHDFIDAANPYKWELGNVNHEGAAGVAALWDYLADLAALAGRAHPARSEAPDRAAIEHAFRAVRSIEESLQARAIERLLGIPGVRIVGPEAADGSRVPTIAFTSAKASPPEISKRLGERGIGIRWGHAYSRRLVEAMAADPDLRIRPETGVARISLQHYNTIDEVDRCMDALAEIA